MSKMQSSMPREGENEDSYITPLFCLAEHCEYGALHGDTIRDRIVVGIVDSSLSLKMQLDSKLTLKKSKYAARQSRAGPDAKLPAKAANVDFVKAKRPWKSHPTKPKMTAKPQSTNRKCNYCGRSPAHQKTREPTCFNCRKVGHFGAVCRSTISVDAISKHPDPEVALLGEVTQNDDSRTSTVAIEAMGTQCRAEVFFNLDTGADVTVISQCDYRRAGSPSLDASTKRLLGANDNVLQALDKFKGRLSQGGAVVDEANVTSESESV